MSKETNGGTGQILLLPLNQVFTVITAGNPALSAWTALEFTTDNSTGAVTGTVTVGGQSVGITNGNASGNPLSFDIPYGGVTYTLQGTYQQMRKGPIEIYNIVNGSISNGSGSDDGTWSATAQTGIDPTD